jgi:hypothetical protein
MTAVEFLETKGINLNTTSLYTILDGYVRQPDLCLLMEEYAKIKILEMDYKVSIDLQNSSELIEQIGEITSLD